MELNSGRTKARDVHMDTGRCKSMCLFSIPPLCLFSILHVSSFSQSTTFVIHTTFLHTNHTNHKQDPWEGVKGVICTQAQRWAPRKFPESNVSPGLATHVGYWEPNCMHSGFFLPTVRKGFSRFSRFHDLPLCFTKLNPNLSLVSSLDVVQR